MAAKSENTGISIDLIRFIIMHPWLFVCPIVIVMSIVSAKIAYSPLVYECKATVSLQMPATANSAAAGNLKIDQVRQDLVNNFLLPENLKPVVKKVWPEVDEESSPASFNGLVDSLKDNIRLSTDKRGPDFLNISFKGPKPDACYKIVTTALEEMKKFSKVKSEEEIESGLTFLKKQLDFYRDRIKAIEEESSKLKTELRKKYPGLNEEDKMLVDEILGTFPAVDASIKTQAKATQLARYDEKLVEVKLELLELEKKKDTINKRLQSQDFTPEPMSLKDLDADPVISQYTNAIVKKELQKANMLSTDYTFQHPEIKRIEEEISTLKKLRESRINDLINSPEALSGARRALEDKMRVELKEIMGSIETTQAKIKTLEGYKKSYESGIVGPRFEKSSIAEQALRLSDLKSEKELSQKYYYDLRQQYEAAEIKSRIEKSEVGLRIEVVEEPKLPANPIPAQSNKQLFFGLVISIILGTGLAYIADSLDTSVRSASELRELLQVPVLAAVDQINTIQDMRMKQFRRNAILISLVAFAVFSRVFFALFLNKRF